MVILAGKKAVLFTPHSSRAGAATSWGSHHAHQLCNWSHAPTAPWRTALTHLGAPRTRISVAAPPRQDTRIHAGHSRPKVALRNCPVFRKAVDPPGSTVILGRAEICRVTPSICFTSRPTGPLEPSYHVTSLQLVSPGSPQKWNISSGELVHGQKYISLVLKTTTSQVPPLLPCMWLTYGRAQGHLTPVMMIQPLAKACGQALSAAAAPGNTVPLGTRACPCPMPWFVLPPVVHTKYPRRLGVLGSLKPEHTIFSLPGTSSHFLGIFLHCAQSLTLQQKEKEKNKMHSFTAATGRRHFVPCFGTLTQEDGRRKAEQQMGFSAG